MDATRRLAAMFLTLAWAAVVLGTFIGLATAVGWGASGAAGALGSALLAAVSFITGHWLRAAAQRGRLDAPRRVQQAWTAWAWGPSLLLVPNLIGARFSHPLHGSAAGTLGLSSSRMLIGFVFSQLVLWLLMRAPRAWLRQLDTPSAPLTAASGAVTSLTVMQLYCWAYVPLLLYLGLGRGGWPLLVTSWGMAGLMILKAMTAGRARALVHATASQTAGPTALAGATQGQGEPMAARLD